MRLNFNRNLQIGYGISILMLIVIGFTSYRTVRQLLDSNQAVQHSALIMQQLEKTMSVMKDAETGQRGYLLTNRTQYLEPYNGAYQQANGLVDQVAALTQDNPRQQRNLQDIRRILQQRLTILHALVEQRQQGRAISPGDLDAGKAAMDALRLAISKAEQDEQALLHNRTAQLNRYAVLAPMVIAAAILLGLLISLLSYLKIVRDIGAKDRLQAALTLKEQETAAANEEITASNEELTAINEELVEAQGEILQLNSSLEEKVATRTRALQESEEHTQALNEELTAGNEELMETQGRLQQTIQELETAYEQVRLSKEAAELGTFDLDLAGDTLEWDERCRALFGISHQDTVTYEKDFVGGLHPDDRQRVLSAIAAAMDQSIGNGDYDIEYRTIGAVDGRLRWVRAKGKVYFDEHGNPVRFIGSVLDMTDHKLQEEQLKESAERQARLAAIVSTSDDTIVSKTLQGMITSWNAAAERMFGYTEQEVLGKHISLIIPPDRLHEEDLIISRISTGGKIDHFETVRLAKDGREVPISLSISPIMDAAGQIIGASKIARDISRQKEYEDKFQRYTRNVEILNTVGKLVTESLDIEAILQRVTDASTQVTGAAFGAFFYNRLDERGESYMLFTLSGAPREAFEKFGMPRNTAIFNPTFSGEEIVRSADITKDPRYGHNRPHHGMPKGHLPVVSYLAVPVISKSGSVIGGLFYGHPEPDRFTEEHEKLVSGIANQASVALDNAKLYEEVQNLNAKKDEFIGLASHELKTPITSLSGFLQIIGKRMPEADANKPFVDKALKQTERLSALIGDLLDVTKIESGQLPLTYSTFDLVGLVRDLIEQLQFTTRTHHIAFHSEATELVISADRQRLEQVIINLLSNAIKYSPRADLVKVSVTGDSERATIQVQDFGMGIALEQQGRIFSRFYRVEGVEDHISGLGIGLYISKEIVNRHKGQLTVESETGKGSVFTIELPVS
jgi:PAS domain S-box-containing protein